MKMTEAAETFVKPDATENKNVQQLEANAFVEVVIFVTRMEHALTTMNVSNAWRTTKIKEKAENIVKKIATAKNFAPKRALNVFAKVVLSAISAAHASKRKVASPAREQTKTMEQTATFVRKIVTEINLAPRPGANVFAKRAIFGIRTAIALTTMLVSSV
jgi:hypothetical protein